VKKKLTILVLLVLVTCMLIWKHKSYSVENIPASADAIAVVDTKRILETLLWELLTTPSQWKPGKLLSSSEEISWRKMFSIPDYIVAFHLDGTPAEKWYMVIPVKNGEKLNQGLLQRGFSVENDLYHHPAGLSGQVYGQYFLIGNTDPAGLAMATEQLQAGKWIEPGWLTSAVQDRKHGVIAIKNNTYTGNIQVTLEGDGYHISTTLKQKGRWETMPIVADTTAIAHMMFTQPPAGILQWLPEKAKGNISRIINMEMDSLVQNGNQYYTFNVQQITTRPDTIVAYEYDENFNPVEKKEIQNIPEPSFSIQIKSKAASQVLQYIKDAGRTETEEGELLFTGIPFAKSYISAGDSTLTIRSYQYKDREPVYLHDGFLYGSLHTKHIPPALKAYLPDLWQKAFVHIRSVGLKGYQENGRSHISIEIKKASNF